MVRRIVLGLFAVAICTFGLSTPVSAVRAADDKKADTKEVKLVGKITCAKCDLGESKTCETVIVVKEKGKDVTYYFDKDAHKKYHGDTCKAGKDGTVTGETKKDGDKMIVTVKDLEYKK